MFYLGSLWHGGGANRTSRPRLGVILEYAAGLAAAAGEPLPGGAARHGPAVARATAELLGYNIYPPFVGYVDGSHPRKVLSRAGKLTRRARSGRTPVPSG